MNVSLRMQEGETECECADRVAVRECLPTPVFHPGEFHGQRLPSMGSQRVGHD